MRIAICADHGATFRSGWSGTPWNIYTGLKNAGVDVISIDPMPPVKIRKIATLLIALSQTRHHPQKRYVDRLRSAREYASNHSIFLLICTWTVRYKLFRAGKVDAVIQMGTHYSVNHPATFSYEDMTVAQALSFKTTHLRFLTPRQQRARIREQHKAYERNALLFYSTDWPAESARQDYNIAPKKIKVVGIGRNYSPQPVAKSWEHPRFLFVGKNFEFKGGFDTLRAFAEVHTIYPDAELHLVGHHPDLDQPGVFGYGALSLGNEQDAKVLDQLWAMATCLVVPAVIEAAGIVFAEAASAGIPSIGSAVGGASYMIGNGGYTVEPGNHDELVSRMLTLAHPKEAQNAGQRAASRSHLFDWDVINGNILHQIEQHLSTTHVED